MCTSIRFNERLFGRTFDYERSYGEELIVAPRGRMKIGEAENRYAVMGIGVIVGETPLYFDGVNEWGLCAAALNFPQYAVYGVGKNARAGVSSAHLISLILGFCRSCEEARDMLSHISISVAGADEKTPPTPLHWMLSDPRSSLVVEPLASGLSVRDNPVGVLTNSPRFDYHLARLADLTALSPRNPLAKNAAPLYSRGMGAIGLPGDFSSSSRFLRAAFLKECCDCTSGGGGQNKADCTSGGVGQAFDILSSVAIPRGAVLSDGGEAVFTRYSALMDMDSPTYYLTTAACRTVRKATLTDSLCEGEHIVKFPIYREEIIAEI